MSANLNTTGRASGKMTAVVDASGVPSIVRSTLESRIWKDLTVRQVPFPYEAVTVGYRVERKYTPDFVLTSSDGCKTILIEVKGFWDAEDRMKMRRVREQNPHLDIRMVFQNQHKRISKTSKTTYGDYCEKYGIPLSDLDGEVPEEWVCEIQGGDFA